MLILLALSGALAAGAPPPGRIDELEREVRRLRGLEARYRTAERSLIGEVEGLSREIELSERERELVDLRITQGETQARELAERASDLEHDLAARRESLRRALVSAYARRSPDWLTALVGAERPADLPTRLGMIRRVSASQSAEIERFAAERHALEQTRQSLDAANGELKRLHAQGESRRADAARARARKEQFLHDIQDRKDEALTELHQAAAQLALFVGDLGQAGEPTPPTDFAGRKGTLPWPDEGPVLKHFGVERHPRFNTLIEHPGIDLGVSPGTPVRAVHAGIVAYADWFKGYGYLVILDHGEGYYTLYAHLAELQVRRTVRVSAGTIVGLAGDTGSLEGPGLYFEIRKGEQALDPEAWLARRTPLRRR